VTHLYALVIAEDRSGRTKRTLTTAGPEVYDYGNPVVVDITIPNGPDRVLVVEMRPGASLSEPVLYAGVSSTFDLSLADPRPQQVHVAMEPVPCLDETDGGPHCAVRVAGADGGVPRSGVPWVWLALDRGRGSGERISHHPEFPACPDDGGCGDAVREDGGMVRWPLSPCEAPTPSLGCARAVYVRFRNDEEYESRTLSATVVLDQVAPALAPGASTVEPPLANPETFLTVRLRADEPLAEPPCLAVVPVVDGGAAPTAPVCSQGSPGFASPPFDGATDVFTFMGSVKVGALVAAPGRYHVLATLQDVVGNKSSVVVVGEFHHDATEPVLADVAVHGGVARDGLPPVFGVPGTIQVSFRAPDAVEVGATLAGGGEFTCRAPEDGLHVCELPLTDAHVGDGEERGDVVWIDARDRAGNPASVSRRVVLDRKPPQVTPVISSATVGMGQSLRYAVTLDEPVSSMSTPRLTAGSAGAGAPVFPGVPDAGMMAYAWTLEPGAWEELRPNRVDYDVEVACADLVGNPCGANALRFNVDVVPPEVELDLAGTFAPDGGAVRLGNQGTLTVTARVGDARSMRAEIQTCGVGASLACAQESDARVERGTLACHVTWTADAPVECARAVRVTVQDDHGNTTQVSKPVVLDAEPPALASLSVDYQPPPGSPLSVVEVAGRGAEVGVRYVARELLVAGAATMVAETPSRVVVEPWVAANSEPTGGRFTRVADGTEPLGPLCLVFTLTDLVGNVGTVRAGGADPSCDDVTVDRPVEFLHQCEGACSFTLGVDQERVRFVRSPWGHGPCAESCEGGVCAQALQPAGALVSGTGVGDLPPGTFTLPRGGGPTKLQVWARPSVFQPSSLADGSGTLLATLDCNGDGSCATKPFANTPQLGVVVTGVDRAGKESLPAPITHAEMVVSLNAASARNPHRLLAMTNVAETLEPPTSVQVPPDREVVASEGCGKHTLVGTKPWRKVQSSGVLPSALLDFSMTYDLARDRVVVVGGYIGTTEVREWDGLRWQVISPEGVGPDLRNGSRMVFDTRRGRPFLFSGVSATLGTPQRDAWEWDGASWRLVWSLPDDDVTSVGPPGREGSVLVHAPDTGHTLMVGGSWLLRPGFPAFHQDAWLWDGYGWVPAPSAGSPPGALAYAAGAYDEARHRYVLFGGVTFTLQPTIGFALLNTLWEFDGATWTRREVSGAWPAARFGAHMAYDGSRGKVVLWSGCRDLRQGGSGSRPFCEAVLGDFWEWDGVAWTAITPPGPRPLARYLGAMTHIPPRQELLLFGGLGRSEWPDIYMDSWAFQDQQWREVKPAVQAPDATYYPAVAYDPDRDVLSTLGGTATDTTVRPRSLWEWNNGVWNVPAAGAQGPGGRTYAVAVYDRGRRTTVLYGGEDDSGALGDLWEWDGANWVDAWSNPPSNPPAVGPRARVGHAMAYDEKRGRVVLFGGDGGPLLNDTWEWDGSSWTPGVDSGSRPSARSDAAMAYCPTLEAIVLFSGWTSGMTGHAADLWRYDHTGWHAIMTADGPWADDPAGATPPTLFSTCTYAGRPVPCPMRYVAMATHHARGTVLLWGGQLRSSRPSDVLWEYDGEANEWARRGPGPGWPAAQLRASLFVRDDDTVLLYGGSTGWPVQEVWHGDFRAGRRPGFTFVTELAETGLDPRAITGLAVRARAGGTQGASLWGWHAAGAALRGGGWTSLARIEETPDGLGGNVNPGLLEWSVSGPAAREYVQGALVRASFQVRSVGVSDADWGEAAVSLDYVEARVRYDLPDTDP
jgi:hypothetical protein